MWKWEISQTGVDELKKIDRSFQKQIIKKMNYFVNSQKPLNFAKRMISSEIGQYRFRVGDYRIIFDVIDNKTVRVLSVGHRREIYK